MQASVSPQPVVCPQHGETTEPQPKVEAYPINGVIELYTVDEWTGDENVTSLSFSEARELITILESAMRM